VLTSRWVADGAFVFLFGNVCQVCQLCQLLGVGWFGKVIASVSSIWALILTSIHPSPSRETPPLIIVILFAVSITVVRLNRGHDNRLLPAARAGRQ
jgi:hypothetical protein